MTSDFNSISWRILDALDQAATSFLADADLPDSLTKGGKAARRLQDIVETLKKDFLKFKPEVKPKRSYIGNKHVEFSSTLRSDDFDVYIIIPIFNADDQQAAACINSIVKNFRQLNFCLVLYTNRPWQALPDLLTTDLNFIQFLSPTFSLPEAYNTCVDYLRKTFKLQEEVLIFMDDDAEIIENQEELIINNLKLTESNQFVATSGQYFDLNMPQTLFESALNYTNSYEFAERCPKPYCHGGAVLMMKAKSYPIEGLPLEGLGGISLSILLINCLDETKYDFDQWFLLNNQELKVLHPRKKTLLQWTSTVMSYEIAWGRALSWLNEKQRKVWEQEIRKSSGFRKHLLVQDAANENDDLALTNLFLTKYYKPILSKFFLYSDFKNFKLQAHIHLQLES